MERLGIIGAADIAYRRFLPALSKNSTFEYIGVGIADKQERYLMLKEKIECEYQGLREKSLGKAKQFMQQFGGKIYDSYNSLITSSEVDAVYIPLPPALHYIWAKKALENGKHVLLEKPATISYEQTEELVHLARSKNLALFENYMFLYHSQIETIKNIIDSGEIGKVRLYRLAFGFPRLGEDNFRYSKKMGGGALLDAGGYTLKYARALLGDSAKIVYANANDDESCDVDIFGSAALVNEEGETVQVAFGMDNEYKCELEAWGSKGTLYTGRVFTAPEGLEIEVVISKNGEETKRILKSDNSFLNSIHQFSQCMLSEEVREKEYENILTQARLVSEYKKLVHDM